MPIITQDSPRLALPSATLIEGIGRHDEMVHQAEAQARWLRELLSNETGRPVVSGMSASWAPLPKSVPL